MDKLIETAWDLSGIFDFKGQRVRYGVLGEGAPLVLLHGTPFSSVVWRRIAPYLATHRRVFYFDLLGYGRSAWQLNKKKRVRRQPGRGLALGKINMARCLKLRAKRTDELKALFAPRSQTAAFAVSSPPLSAFIKATSLALGVIGRARW